MNAIVKITTVGNSVGIVLPKEVLAELNVEKGDSLFLTKAPDGFRMSPYDSALARKLDALETVMRENRDVLRKLAE